MGPPMPCNTILMVRPSGPLTQIDPSSVGAGPAVTASFTWHPEQYASNLLFPGSAAVIGICTRFCAHPASSRATPRVIIDKRPTQIGYSNLEAHPANSPLNSLDQ